MRQRLHHGHQQRRKGAPEKIKHLISRDVMLVVRLWLDRRCRQILALRPTTTANTRDSGFIRVISSGGKAHLRKSINIFLRIKNLRKQVCGS
jgi:hypothetical protein